MVRKNAHFIAILILGGMTGFLPVALAQKFPQGSAWAPLYCEMGIMRDNQRDQSGAIDERDLVGTKEMPAGLVASDSDFLYLKLRLDKDPLNGKKLRPFAWGVMLGIDSNLSTYELLIMVDGKSEKVLVYKNTTSTKIDDPRDPADQPPVAAFPFSTHGQSEKANSSLGYSDDYFISMAVPWSNLATLNFTPKTPVAVWAGSSSTADALDGDLACHNGATGLATLKALSSEQHLLLDPERDSDGDGYSDKVEVEAGTDPINKDSHPSGPPSTPNQPLSGNLDLEGGGGCHWLPSSPSLPLKSVSPIYLTFVLWLGIWAWRKGTGWRKR